MKFCINCGTELDDDALFCTECGCPVEEENESPASTVDLSKPTDILSPDDEEAPSDEGETGVLSDEDIFGVGTTLLPSDEDNFTVENDVPSEDISADEDDVPSEDISADEDDVPSEDIHTEEDETPALAATENQQGKKSLGSAGFYLVSACLCLLTFVLGIGVGVGIGRHYSAVSGSDLVSPADIVITAQPVDAEGYVEDAISFQVTAEGENLAYQWYYRKADETEFTAWKNKEKAKATSKVYASWNNAEYYCEITDGDTTVRTDTVHLTVLPKIILQPVNQIGSVNKTVTFDVEATGAGLQYQWYYKKAGVGSWTRWNKRTKPSATTNVYASWDNTEYYCEITDANGNILKSNTVKLIVG